MFGDTHVRDSDFGDSEIRYTAYSILIRTPLG